MIKEFEFREEMYLNIIPKNLIGCEIGVCKGLNAINLYHATKPKIFHLVDSWESNENKELLRPELAKYQVDDYEEDVKKIFSKEIEDKCVKLWKMKSNDYFKMISDNYLDWIYIDGDHFYKSVKSDITASLKKVKKGGIIMGHDFHCGHRQRSGVIRAVIESIQNKKMEMIAISSETWASWACRVL